MKTLPLYKEPPLLAVEDADKLEINPTCTECPRHETAQTICMPPVGYPGNRKGTLLVIGAAPNKIDDRKGYPFASTSGDTIHQILARYWEGSVVYDYAVKCYSTGSIAKEDITQCRRYLAWTSQAIKDLKAVLVMGEKACYGVLGHAPSWMSLYRAYAWMGNTPVFIMPDILAIQRNRFVRRAFEKQVRWALKSPQLWPTSPAATLVEDEGAWEVEDDLLKYEWCAFDCETSGTMFTKDFRLISVSICGNGSDTPYVWDRDVIEGNSLGRLVLVRLLMRLRLVGHNGKFDSHAVKQGLDVDVQNYIGDTRVQRRLLASESNTDLDTMANMVGMGGHKEEAQKHALSKNLRFRRQMEKLGPESKEDERLVREIARGGKYLRWVYALIDPEIRQRYVARDTLATARLMTDQMNQLEEEPDIKRIAYETAIPAIPAYVRMEQNGMGLNVEKCKTLGTLLRQKQLPILDRLKAYPRFKGHDMEEMRTFMNSPKQRIEFLYDDLGIDPPEGRRSSDKAALEALDHPAAQDMRLWNELEKLRGTYAEGLPSYVGDDERIHPSFHTDSTRTGRSSCTNPNLQNIPAARGELSKLCKDVFESAKGKRIIQLDYSQLELRVAAMLSGDEEMIKIFESGEDYHQRTAELIGKDRSVGKTINFALVYRKGDEGLAKQLGVDIYEARAIRREVLGKLKGFDTWAKAQVVEVKQTGYVWTYWRGNKARRRHQWDIAESSSKLSSRASRVAVNTPIQGSANEFKVASIIELDKIYRNTDVMIIGEVHDSILFEVPDEKVKSVIQAAKKVMESWPSCGIADVPLVVDVEVGQSWGSLEEYKET